MQIPTRRVDLIRTTAKMQGVLLRRYKVGHPEWYAEVLVAGAFDGIIEPTNNPSFDVTTRAWGRVQVKSRVNGTDGSQNRVNFGRYVDGAFDHAAIVIFESDFTIMGATMLACPATLSLVRRAGHVSWPSARDHCDAKGIADLLRTVSGE